LSGSRHPFIETVMKNIEEAVKPFPDALSYETFRVARFTRRDRL